jgi:putative copper resistance protein D
MGLNPAWDIAFGTLIAALAWWYRSEDPSRLGVGRGRQALFNLGLTLAFIVLVGPIPHLAVRIFAFHMVQHVGLMMLIAPLLILGSPAKVLLGSKYSQLRRFSRALANNFLFRQLFRPEVGFIIFLTTLILTHFSPLANWGMVNSNIHSLTLLLFLISGSIYYLPVLTGNPSPYPASYAARVLSLFVMMLPETMTGFFLYSGNHLLHDHLANISAPTALNDQRAGGAIMWAMGMLVDAIWIALAVKEWFANEKLLGELGDE